MNTLTQGQLVDLEGLIGEAKEYTRIVEILSDSLIWSNDHENGQLVLPLHADDEPALMTAIHHAGTAVKKLHDYFHKAAGSG